MKEIVEVIAKALVDHPEKVNEAPETDAWFCKLESFDQDALKKLMTPEAYQTFLAE